jgi:hypothetical protein
MRILIFLGVLLLAGCAVRRYESAPIVPSDTASRFETRSLADSGLQAYETSVVATRVSLGDGANSLFQSNGTALVIHEKADDNLSDPAGNAGSRIACGVVQK